MRHRRKGRKLKRKKSARRSLLVGLAVSLITRGHLETSEAKAKEAKALAGRLIHLGRQKQDSARRKLIQIIRNRQAVRMITGPLARAYADRSSGFVRSYRLGRQLGDNAGRMRLELIDFPKDGRKGKAKNAKPDKTSQVKNKLKLGDNDKQKKR